MIVQHGRRGMNHSQRTLDIITFDVFFKDHSPVIDLFCKLKSFLGSKWTPKMLSHPPVTTPPSWFYTTSSCRHVTGLVWNTIQEECRL